MAPTLYSYINIMKIVKRVSLYRAVERLHTPGGNTPMVDHSRWNQAGPWRMPIDMELFKYGYRNKPRTLTMGILGVLAVLLGLTVHTTELELQHNEMRTIYSYRLRQTVRSTIWLYLRLALHWLLAQQIYGQIFPLFDYVRLQGYQTALEEKHIRYQQYKYYMKRRDDKYDFMELGVLEKFPYPFTAQAGDGQE